jgi:hypothetical protein
MIQGRSPSTFLITSVSGIANTPITFCGVKKRGTSNTATADLTWPTLSGVNTYCIKLSKDSLFATSVTSVCGLSSPGYFNSTAACARLEVGGQVYFYQVVGVDANGVQSPWSKILSVEVLAAVTSIDESLSVANLA